MNRSSKFTASVAVQLSHDSSTKKKADPVPGGAVRVPLTWCHAPSAIGATLSSSKPKVATEQVVFGYQSAPKITLVATSSDVRYQNEAACCPGWTVMQMFCVVVAPIPDGAPGPLRCMLALPE